MSSQMEYGQFARIYNRYLAPEQTAVNIDRLRRRLFPKIQAGASILDLCCGTGLLTRELLKRGYQAVGLDISEDMLSFARQNAPGARFFQGDACNFEAGKSFDAVICMSDSLNHMLYESDLERVFACVMDALKPGGLFAFDLNKPDKYTTELFPSISFVEDDQVCIIRTVFDEKSRIATFVPTVFFQEDGWQRFDAEILQKAHETETVLDLLKKAGFKGVVAHDLEKDPGDKTPEKRNLFICRK